VWHDQNRDGIQDPGEPGVPGVTVTLYDSTGTPITTTTTDTTGYYIFPNLQPGTYFVGFSNLPPELNVFTIQHSGSDTSVDSNADPTTGITPPVR
jgi:hypothetical protein